MSRQEGGGHPCDMLTKIPRPLGLCWWNKWWEQGEVLWMTDGLAVKVPLGLHRFPAHPPHSDRWKPGMEVIHLLTPGERGEGGRARWGAGRAAVVLSPDAFREQQPVILPHYCPARILSQKLLEAEIPRDQ